MKNFKFFLLFFVCTLFRSFLFISTAFPDSLNGIDDANIFFRYVENFYNYGEIFWNIGEGRVEGFSSPLWFVLLVVFRAFTADLTFIAYFLNILFTAGIIFEIFLVLKKYAGNTHPFLVVILALTPLVHPALFFWSGVSLMDFTIWVFLISRLTRKVVLEEPCNLTIILLAICRPEGLGLGFATLGFLFLSRRINLISSFTTGLCCLLPIYLRFLYFGYPFPNTFYAKVNNIKYKTAHIYISDFFIQYPIHAIGLISLFILTYLSFKKEKFYHLQKLTLYFWLITAFFIAFIISVSSDHFAYHRLLLPIAVILIVSFSILIFNFKNSILKLIFTACFFALSLIAQRTIINNELYLATVSQKIGRYFNALFPDEKPIISIITVGGIGYTYSGKIFDLVGLNDLELAHFSKEREGLLGHAIFDREIFYKRMPNFIIQICDAPSESSKNMKYLQKVMKKTTFEPKFIENYTWFSLGTNQIINKLINTSLVLDIKKLLPAFDEKDLEQADFFCGYIRKDFIETTQKRVDALNALGTAGTPGYK